MPIASARPRIEALTGVRILAATVVFFSHIGAPVFAPARMQTFMLAGYNGVTLFFVLSGFVLAYNYTDRLVMPSGRALWSFFVARIARIYPLYLFALVFAAAPFLVNSIPTTFWMHALAIQTWHPSVMVADSFNGPGWSIGVEFFLYACFPVLVLFMRGIRTRPGALLAVGAGAVLVTFAMAWWFVATGRAATIPTTDGGSAHRWLYRMPLTRLGDFIIGVVAAMLIRCTKPAPAWGALAQGAGAISLVVVMSSRRLLFSAWSWDAAYMVPVALLLWGLAANDRTVLARALGSRPAVVAGNASFAFYLLHAPLLGLLHIDGPATWAAWMFTTALMYTLIMMLAIGAHVALEVPAQQWIKRAIDWRKMPQTVVVVMPEGRVPVSLTQP